jgi:glutathione S-transferase
MSECQECGKSFAETRWWQSFCSTNCRQLFHRRKYQAEAVEDELNGKRDRGTKEERRAAKAALSAFTQSLRRPDVGVAEPAVLKRRF